MKRIGVDVGGTFTDLILVDEEAGRITVDKVPSTPDDPARGVHQDHGVVPAPVQQQAEQLLGVRRTGRAGHAGTPERTGLVRGVLARAIDLRLRVAIGAPVCRHYATTSTPIERAVPAMIFAACSMSLAFRSAILRSAICSS